MFYVFENYFDYVFKKIDLGIDINDFLVNVIYFNVYNVGVVEDKIFFFYCYV